MSELSYLRDDGSYISHEELEERCIKYIRNIVIGLRREITREMLENWLKLDSRLALLPPSSVLDNLLEKCTPEFLLEWSYNNDFNRKREDN